MATPKTTLPKIYTLHVELDGVEPPIWRRILVPAGITLPELHQVLQVVMGWTGSHLHSFIIGDLQYSCAEADLDELEMSDEKGHKLNALLEDKISEFTYEYDFGDSWNHHITVESITKPKRDWTYPLCVDGARACPPEDVGGIGGYQDFLEIIADPDHEEHHSMLLWIGGAFDPEGFDLNAVNRELRSVGH